MMGGLRRIFVLFAASAALLLVALLVGCGGETTTTTGVSPETATTVGATTESTAGPVAGGTVVLMTHDSFAASENVLAAFTAETGITVQVLKSGDAGAMLNQAILTKDNPLGDVLYGVDNTFLSRALASDLFEPYEAAGLDRVSVELQLDPQHRVTPIDFGDICLNYDKAYFADAGIAPPTSLRDLTKPEYKSLLVVENPATSSPGLAFVLATVAEFGETGDYTWQDFWRDLVANDVLAVSGWEEAYYSSFSGGSGEGDRPLVVSYASSPPAEVIFSETPLTEAPTAVVTAGAFRQIEFAGVLRGAKNPEGARRFVDFMLSRSFQEDIPLNMFVFPANQDAALPPEFLQYTEVPVQPLSVDTEAIEQNRDRWIEEWTAIVL
ncbi:MAG: thiamine ABC transporter substrate-binding protein [Thermoleophilia bacterium]